MNPGEYLASVVEVKSTRTLSGELATEVVFWADEGIISALFSQTIPFHMDKLLSLKIAAGLNKSHLNSELIGKSCRIKVILEKRHKPARLRVSGYTAV